jgi:hypothetical protein
MDVVSAFLQSDWGNKTTVIKQSEDMLTGFLPGRSGVVKLPLLPAHRAGRLRRLRQLRRLYNGYDHHARVIRLVHQEIPGGPLDFAVVEHVAGIDLARHTAERTDLRLAWALGEHFRGQHARARAGTSRQFLTHARRFLAAQPEPTPLRRRAEDRLVQAAGDMKDPLPRVWAHADPSPLNVLVTPGGSVRFIDRHRERDWIFVDLAMVVFLLIEQAADGYDRLAFIRHLLRAYGFAGFPAAWRRLARSFWAAVALYLASPTLRAIHPAWARGPEVALLLLDTTGERDPWA